MDKNGQNNKMWYCRNALKKDLGNIYIFRKITSVFGKYIYVYATFIFSNKKERLPQMASSKEYC